MWLSFLVSILVLLIVIFVWRFVAHLWAAPKESASHQMRRTSSLGSNRVRGLAQEQ